MKVDLFSGRKSKNDDDADSVSQSSAEDEFATNVARSRWELLRSNTLNSSFKLGTAGTSSDVLYSVVEAEKGRAKFVRKLYSYIRRWRGKKGKIVEICKAISLLLNSNFEILYTIPAFDQLMATTLESLWDTDISRESVLAICELLEQIAHLWATRGDVFNTMAPDLIVSVAAATSTSPRSRGKQTMEAFIGLLEFLMKNSEEEVVNHADLIISGLASIDTHINGLESLVNSVMKSMDALVGGITNSLLRTIHYAEPAVKSWCISYLASHWDRLVNLERKRSANASPKKTSIFKQGTERIWCPGDPELFIEALNSALRCKDNTVIAFATDLLSTHLKPAIVPSTGEDGKLFEHLVDSILSVFETCDDDTAALALKYLKQASTSSHSRALVNMVRDLVDASDLQQGLRIFASLLDEDDLASLLVPSTFGLWLKELTNATIDSGLTESFSKIISTLRQKFPSFLFDPITQAIASEDISVICSGVVQVTLLVEYGNSDVIFPHELFNKCLPMSSTLGRLAFLFQCVFTVGKARASRANGTLGSRFKTVESAFEGWTHSIALYLDRAKGEIPKPVLVMLCKLLYEIQMFSPSMKNTEWMPHTLAWACSSSEPEEVEQLLELSIELSNMLNVARESWGLDPQNDEDYLAIENFDLSSVAMLLLERVASKLQAKDLEALAPIAWLKLLHRNPKVVKSAAVVFLYAAEYAPQVTKSVMCQDFYSPLPKIRLRGMRSFQKLWNERTFLNRIYNVMVPPQQPKPPPTDKTWIDVVDDRFEDAPSKNPLAPAGDQDSTRRPSNPNSKSNFFAMLPKISRAMKGNLQKARTTLQRTPKLPLVLSVAAFPLIDLCLDEFTEVFLACRALIKSAISVEPFLFLRVFFEQLGTLEYEMQSDLLYRLGVLHSNIELLPQRYAHILFNNLVGLLHFNYQRNRDISQLVVSTVPLLTRLAPFLEDFSVGKLRTWKGDFLLNVQRPFSKDGQLKTDLNAIGPSSRISQFPAPMVKHGSRKESPFSLAALVVTAAEVAQTHPLHYFKEQMAVNSKLLFLQSIVRAYADTAPMLLEFTYSSFVKAVKTLATHSNSGKWYSFLLTQQRLWLKYIGHTAHQLQAGSFLGVQEIVEGTNGMIISNLQRKDVLLNAIAILIDLLRTTRSYFQKHGIQTILQTLAIAYQESNVPEAEKWVEYSFCQIYRDYGQSFAMEIVTSLVPSRRVPVSDIIKPQTIWSLVKVLSTPNLKCQELEDELHTSFVASEAQPYYVEQFVGLIVSVINYDWKRGQPFIEMFGYLMEEIQSLGRDTWNVFLHAFFRQVVSEAKKIKHLPRATKQEFVAFFGRLSKLDPQLHNSQIVHVGTLVDSLLTPDKGQLGTPNQNSVQWLADYILQGLCRMPQDSHQALPGAQQVILVLDKLIFELNSSTPAIHKVINALQILVRSHPYTVGLFSVNLVRGCVALMHQPNTPRPVAQSVTGVVVELLETGPFQLTQRMSAASLLINPSKRHVEGEVPQPTAYLRYIGGTFIPIALSVGRQGFSSDRLAFDHWTWLLNSILPAFQIRSIIPDACLALKTLMVRAPPYLASSWPRVLAVLVPIFASPVTKLGDGVGHAILDLVEFIALSKSSLNTVIAPYVPMLTKKLDKTHEEMVSRIYKAQHSRFVPYDEDMLIFRLVNDVKARFPDSDIEMQSLVTEVEEDLT